ncbi:hypothetical protein G7085_02645 [Tessaracoccus sp. HDW20]|uniref:hypothetical protein n=1 Tax=Tessaracoccus coleopterorum TaxID=2714950 RepID=UPI0018D2B720|nr:hypothetical protein [Tessaracoccus coleopterorum]
MLILVATLRPLLHDPFATAAVGDCITLYTSEDAPGETIACDDTVNYSVLVTGIEAPQGCGYEEVYYEVRDWLGFGTTWNASPA